MKKKVLAVVLALSMCAGALTACGVPDSKKSSDNKSTDGKKTSSENVLRYATRQDPPTLDPQLMNSIPCTTIGVHIFDGLMRYQDGELKEASAESYEVSEDGLTYTFKLKDGLKWSDGEPVKAADYAYGMQRLVDPVTASEYAFIGTVIKNAAKVSEGEVPVDQLGVKAVDDKTLEVTLEYPAPYFLGMLANASFSPTRKDVAEKNGKEFAGEADKNVYNGPFVIKEWKHNDRVILEKNPNYWDADSVKLDGVEVLTVADANTAVAMYEEGELDFTDVPQAMSTKYKDQSEAFFDGSADFVTLNQDGSNPYLANKNMRNALNYAMNREDYIKLLGGVYEPSTRYVLPEVQGVKGTYGEDYKYDAWPVKGDADKAKEYLKTAMSELSITKAEEINLELLIADTESYKKQAEVIQSQLQDTLGIKVSIKQVPYKQRLKQETDHDFQMVISGWVPDYNDPISYLEIWQSDSSYNRASYSNETYDNYLKESAMATDPKERMDLLFKAEQQLCEDSVIIPTQFRRMEMLKNDRVQNLKTSFVGYQYDFMHVELK